MFAADPPDDINSPPPLPMLVLIAEPPLLMNSTPPVSSVVPVAEPKICAVPPASIVVLRAAPPLSMNSLPPLMVALIAAAAADAEGSPVANDRCDRRPTDFGFLECAAADRCADRGAPVEHLLAGECAVPADSGLTRDAARDDDLEAVETAECRADCSPAAE
jgi:hypothetical protein